MSALKAIGRVGSADPIGSAGWLQPTPDFQVSPAGASRAIFSSPFFLKIFFSSPAECKGGSCSFSFPLQGLKNHRLGGRVLNLPRDGVRAEHPLPQA